MNQPRLTKLMKMLVGQVGFSWKVGDVSPHQVDDDDRRHPGLADLSEAEY